MLLAAAGNEPPANGERTRIGRRLGEVGGWDYPAKVSVQWSRELADQLGWHWDHHLRPKLTELDDAEYRWEPVPGCWNIRPRPDGTAGLPGSGPFTIDFAWPEPSPPPVVKGHQKVTTGGHEN